MTFVRVSVRNAIEGSELLPATDFECGDLAAQLRSALGHRPSRPVKIFHDGALMDDRFMARPGDVLDLSAVMELAISDAARERFLNRIESVRYSNVHNERALLERSQQISELFRLFPEAARDDDTLVRAAMGRSHQSFAYASEFLRNDRHFVRSAPHCFEYAGEALKADRAFVLDILRIDHSLFRHIHADLRDDFEIVLQVVRQKPSYLYYAGERCKDHPLIVLTAVGIDPEAIQFASTTCQLTVAGFLGVSARMNPPVAHRCEVASPVAMTIEGVREFHEQQPLQVVRWPHAAQFDAIRSKRASGFVG